MAWLLILAFVGSSLPLQGGAAAEEEEEEGTTTTQMTAEEAEEERQYALDPAQRLVCRFYENQYPELEEVGLVLQFKGLRLWSLEDGGSGFLSPAPSLALSCPAPFFSGVSCCCFPRAARIL